MRKILIISIFLPFLNSCIEKKEEKTDEIEIAELENEIERINPIVYVSNPDPNDEQCISEIDKAKIDIQKEGVVFTQVVGFLSGHIRYENELKQLCKENGLKYDFVLTGCTYGGKIQSCYSSYMDKVLAQKYGSLFKKEMHKKADSIFLKNVLRNNIAVSYIDCDERPKLPGETERYSDHIPFLKVTKIDIKSNDSDYGGWPFFDIGFIVEKDSTISNLHVNYFVAEVDSNEKYKTQLFDLVTDYIKRDYPIWVPGIVNGVQVRTKNNVRIHLVRE
jgi:hypothetical protein